jgi:hypothetical protein
MRRAATLVIVVVAAVARAGPFPARSGESGILGVPDAEVLDPGTFALSGELAAREGRDPGDSVSPARLALVTGLGRRVEAGLSVHEDGTAGDRRRAAALFGAALKVGLWRPRGLVPGLALDATLDRINLERVGTVRLIGSIGRVGPLRLSGYVGAVASGLRSEPGLGRGVAASLGSGTLEIAADMTSGPEGRRVGAALRWMRSPKLGVAVGVGYTPGHGLAEVTLAIALAAAPPRSPAPDAREENARPARDLAPAPAPRGTREFPTDRPRFPVKRRAGPAGEGAR